MSQAIGFTNCTPRNELPYLFAGQAQKEFFVNEALSRLDMLLHPMIEAILSSPPASPEAGACYIVGAEPGDEWTGKEGSIAGWIDGQWTFVAPNNGLIVYDRQTAGSLVYRDGWVRHQAPSLPSGGSTIDTEARDAIEELVAILRQHGVFP